jgi:3-oxoacyl-[acyl-carrier protein] reductase
MNLSLLHKNALVCGSSAGIGKATAIALATLGANITLVARNEEKLKKVIQELPVAGDQQHDYWVADFSQPNELKKIVESALVVSQKNYHILINNTGGPAAGPAIDASSEQFTAAFASHLLCNHILVQALVEGMKKEKYGRIVNVISTSVKIPLQGLGVSNTIRGAVANWSKTLATELASFGITVNNVLPGATATERLDTIIQNKSTKAAKSTAEMTIEMQHEIPMKRFGMPEEIANAIAFLVSPAASYITGINLPVDGGRTGSL